MKRIMTPLIFVTSALIYFFIIPEILFRHLSDQSYHFFTNLTNPFNIFGSTANSLIIALVALPLLLAWLTVIVYRKIFSAK